MLLVGMVAQDHQDAEPLLDAPGAMWAQKVRLPDACFMQVCGAFFDSDCHVREETCKASALGLQAFLKVLTILTRLLVQKYKSTNTDIFSSTKVQILTAEALRVRYSAAFRT